MKISDLLRLLNISNSIVNNSQAAIIKIKQPAADDLDDSTVVWVSEKNSKLISQISKGTIICSKKTPDSLFNSRCNYLLVDNPRATFRELLQKVFVKEEEAYVSARAFVHPSVHIDNTVTIGHNVIIEEGCVIGRYSVINHNTVVYKNTVIGNNVKIGSNNTIGGVGFGYEKVETGDYELIPHIGNVVIEDGVEIGNNTTIDRGVIGSTLLERNVKVDNLVHIAHGVTIGENSLIIANSMIAGSVIIGKNAWVAPSSSILNNKKVGDNSVIGMGAVVLKDVDANAVIVGNPGKRLSRNE